MIRGLNYCRSIARHICVLQNAHASSATAAAVNEEQTASTESTPKSPSTAQQEQGIPVDRVPEGGISSASPSSSLPSADNRDVSPHVCLLVDQIVGLSLMEVSDLNWALKKRLNIPDMPVGMMPMGAMMAAGAATAGAGAQEQVAVEEEAPTKISYTVKLTKFDETNKIPLIKEVRSAIPGMNLVQAKKLIESAPVDIKCDIGKADADKLKEALEKVGGYCEIV